MQEMMTNTDTTVAMISMYLCSHFKTNFSLCKENHWKLVQNHQKKKLGGYLMLVFVLL